MPFEVFSPFYSCRDIPEHDKHFKLKDAAACFDEIKKSNGGSIPIYPISGKYIHAIVAVDKDGNQKDFTPKENRLVKSLGLDCKSVMTERLGITTFGETARMYYEALRLVPITAFNLGEALDYKNKDRHFWATDAGQGQALAYTQQALFTLELSLKAVLEVLGKFEKDPSVKRQVWWTHDLIDLLELLEAEHKQRLEQQWASLPKSERNFDGTLKDLLTSYRDAYEKIWRYVPELKGCPLYQHRHSGKCLRSAVEFRRLIISSKCTAQT